MKNQKQSAISRRLSKTSSSSVFQNLETRIESIENTVLETVNQVSQTTNTLASVKEATESTQSLLSNQLNSSNSGSVVAEIEELKQSLDDVGSGGIDPTDPSQPILIFDNFVSQSNGNPSGSLLYFPTHPEGVLTGSQLLNPNGPVILEAPSETDHVGVVRCYTDVNGYLSINNGNTLDSVNWENFNRAYFIIKPLSTDSDYTIQLGLFDDIDAPTKGVYVTGTRGGDWEFETKDTGTTTETATGFANDWIKIRIEKLSATSAVFQINNDTEVIITTDVPSGYFTFGIRCVIDTDPFEFLIDFFSLKLGETTPVVPSGTTIEGTANEVEVTTTGSTVTIGLPPSITVDEVKTDEVSFDTTITAPTLLPGQMSWDTEHDTVILQGSSTVHIPLGHGLYQHVHNNSGGSISKGEVVYISGSQGTDRLRIAKSLATSEATSAPTVGLAAETIANGSDGYVITYGLLTGLNTNTYTAGQPLFLSDTTPGGWRTTFPTAPNHGTFIGWVVKSAGSGAGSVFVKINNYNEISELSDVLISSPSNDQALVYESSSGVWKNKTIAGGGVDEDFVIAMAIALG
jgi:hypothetical protein